MIKLTKLHKETADLETLYRKGATPIDTPLDDMDYDELDVEDEDEEDFLNFLFDIILFFLKNRMKNFFVGILIKIISQPN